MACLIIYRQRPRWLFRWRQPYDRYRIHTLTINTSGTAAGTLTLNGNVSLDRDGSGSPADLTLTGGVDVIVIGARTIDTESGNNEASGNVNFGTSRVYGSGAGTSLTINADNGGGFAAGNVQFGAVGNGGRRRDVSHRFHREHQ